MADLVATKEREKEVNVQMQYLDESVSNLNQTVERLGPSLSEVLSESVPKEADEEMAEKTICALAHRIRLIRYRIDTVEEYVREKLKRIEV